MNKTLYEILGVREDADSFGIRDAAQARAKEINDAYTTLSNENLRQAYDAYLREQRLQHAEIAKHRFQLHRLIYFLSPALFFAILAFLLHIGLRAYPAILLSFPVMTVPYIIYTPFILLILGIILSIRRYFR